MLLHKKRPLAESGCATNTEQDKTRQYKATQDKTPADVGGGVAEGGGLFSAVGGAVSVLPSGDVYVAPCVVWYGALKGAVGVGG